MKKPIAFAICAVLTLCAAAPLAALAADVPAPIAPVSTAAEKTGYTLQIDGEDVGVAPYILVPLRTLAEKLGFTVTWNGDNTIGIENGTTHSTITVGQDLYQVSTYIEGSAGMSAPFSLGVGPYVVDGTTYVPLGLFEALLGSQKGTVTMENGVISIRTSSLESQGGAAQLLNPFTNCDTLAAAEALTGFQLTAPDAINQSASRLFRAAEGGMLEIIYQDGEVETARIRKAPGTEDISGDYTDYAKVSTVSVGSVQVAMKGENDRVALAIWTNGGYTYSVTVESPMSSAHMTKLVSAIQ